MKKPKNDWQKALWYLLTFKQVDMKFVIHDSLFYKFQTRLSEVELDHGKLANRDTVKFTKPNGNKSHYFVYSLKDRRKALDVYDKL